MPISCLGDAIIKERELNVMSSGFTEQGVRMQSKFEASLGYPGETGFWVFNKALKRWEGVSEI